MQACGIRITAPTAGSTVTGFQVLVQGTLDASLGSDVGVTVNGAVAYVGGGRFAALVPAPASLTTLTASATDAQGVSLATTAISVTAQPAEPVVHVLASPAAGIAPLAVTFSLAGRAATQVTVDLQGTGASDFQGPSLDGQVFTYAQPGLYVPRITVTDATGGSHTVSTIVQAFDQAGLDGLLQARWQAFRDALRQGDIAGAVQHITLRARPRYQADFTTLASDLPAIDTILTPITFVRLRGREAIYTMRRTDGGVAKAFEVRFRVDTDGIWRLAAF